MELQVKIRPSFKIPSTYGSQIILTNFWEFGIIS